MHFKSLIISKLIINIMRGNIKRISEKYNQSR